MSSKQNFLSYVWIKYMLLSIVAIINIGIIVMDIFIIMKAIKIYNYMLLTTLYVILMILILIISIIYVVGTTLFLYDLFNNKNEIEKIFKLNSIFGTEDGIIIALLIVGLIIMTGVVVFYLIGDMLILKSLTTSQKLDISKKTLMKATRP